MIRLMRIPATIIAIAVVAMNPAGWPAPPLEARQRPPVIGRQAGVSAGHPLTTAVAVEILQQGGNAFDAGVAAMLVGGVVEQDLYGFGGEGLVLVYPRAERAVTSIVGQGWAPKGATIEWYSSATRRSTARAPIPSCQARRTPRSPCWSDGAR
jgi:gamma-glutamyltranspeptidase/glutathione hydrolase